MCKIERYKNPKIGPSFPFPSWRPFRFVLKRKRSTAAEEDRPSESGCPVQTLHSSFQPVRQLDSKKYFFKNINKDVTGNPATLARTGAHSNSIDDV